MNKPRALLLAMALVAQNSYADIYVTREEEPTLLYYREGDEIVMKNCGLISKLSRDSASARKNCVAVEKRIPVNEFIASLRERFAWDRKVALYPRLAAADQAMMQNMAMRHYGARGFFISFLNTLEGHPPGKGTSSLREEEMREISPESRAQKETELEIAKVMKLISDPKKIVDYQKFFDHLVPAKAILYDFIPGRVECGTDEILSAKANPAVPKTPQGPKSPDGESNVTPGAFFDRYLFSKAFAASNLTASKFSIEDRIRDCAQTADSTKVGNANSRDPRKKVVWNLVTRKKDPESGRFIDVWKDSKTGLLWSDQLDKEYLQSDIAEIKRGESGEIEWHAIDGKVLQEKACISPDGKKATAGITEKSFGIPTLAEANQASQDGIGSVVGGGPFWTSATGYHMPKYYDLRPVRCVGR